MAYAGRPADRLHSGESYGRADARRAVGIERQAIESSSLLVRQLGSGTTAAEALHCRPDEQ